MYDILYRESLKRAKHKIWIFSDLQQSNPAYAKECLDICMADFEAMESPAEMIWYLGDSVESDNREHLTAMCEMQEEAFVKTGLPLCYALGNHDMDYVRHHREEPVWLPFYEMVKKHDNWHVAEDFTKPYFKVELGEFVVYFFCDHIAPDHSWRTSHGHIIGDAEAYPYGEGFEQIRREMEAEGKPVITASHYAYPGGNRESEWMGKLFPLPENLKIHFYGHAHIGDYRWAEKDACRRICWTDWHDIPQINVSSYEHIRGQKCRSVFLHIYEDQSFGIFFRNHDDRVFSEAYFPAKENIKAFEGQK